MKNRFWLFAAASCVSAAAVIAACAQVGQSAPSSSAAADSAAGAGGYQSEPVRDFERDGKKSGYLFATAETRALQDDDFQNPGFLWVDQGEQLWIKAEGEAGKSCMSCHGPAAKMRGVGATYPKVSKDTGKLITLEQQINYCRTERMKAPALAWESREMLSLNTFVMHQSRGLPINVSIDGPAKPFFEAGRKLYEETRRGQLNFACVSCHEYNSGNYIRSDLLSEGQISGFPTYRLKWQTVGSLQRRIRGCYQMVRAEPPAAGSEELNNLNLYIAWRSNGLLVEAPSVRR